MIKARIGSVFVTIVSGYFLLFLLFSCGGPDVKTVNQVKTFGPQWVSLKEKLDGIDKNLIQLQGLFESHFEEFEPRFGKVRDSIGRSETDSLRRTYQQLLLKKNTVREKVIDLKLENQKQSESYDAWEKLVMKGKVNTADASTELRKFKGIHGDLEKEAAQQKQDLHQLVENHNTLFRRFSVIFNSPANFDIVLKH